MAGDDKLKDLEHSGLIDVPTFLQVLEMDDDDVRRFSRDIVFEYFEQAESTFGQMQDSLEEKDLETLSKLGHFLKGSSATLGVAKVRDSCEKIQNLGAHKDESGAKDLPDDETCLDRLEKTIAQAKQEFEAAEDVLKRFYD